MFRLTEWKQTRFYQEVKAEGIQEGLQESIPIGRQQEKMETVPRLLKLGLSAEQVAQALELSVEEVRAIRDCP